MRVLERSVVFCDESRGLGHQLLGKMILLGDLSPCFGLGLRIFLFLLFLVLIFFFGGFFSIFFFFFFFLRLLLNTLGAFVALAVHHLLTLLTAACKWCAAIWSKLFQEAMHQIIRVLKVLLSLFPPLLLFCDDC